VRTPSIAVAALLLSSGVAAAQQLPIPDIPFEKFVLDNGLTLVVHEDHKAPVVAVHVTYQVGSKDERPGRTGFAHLFEHLMNQGSENANEDHAPALARLGATDRNATTSEDRTRYYETVPVAALDTVLWLEADRMGHLLGAIDQATLEDVGHWFRTFYGPSNAVLVVAGDVTTQDVRTRVERYFGGIPPGPPLTRAATWVAPLTAPVRQVMQDHVPLARIYQAWNTATWGTPDDASLALAAEVLGTGRDSRLQRRLVHQDRLVTEVTVRHYPMQLSSGLYIEATVAPGCEVRAVEAALEEELAAFRRDGPTPEEVERAKTYVVGEALRASERVGGTEGKAAMLAAGESMAGDPGAFVARLAAIRAVAPREVRAAVQRWLGEGSCVLEVLPFAPTAATPPSAPAPPRPEPATSVPARLPQWSRARLSSGVDVVVLRRRGAPLVEVQLQLDAGISADPPDRSGLAELSTRLLREGTATRSASEITDQLRGLGAELRTATDLDTTRMMLSVPRVALGAALDVLADMVVSPAFPPAEFERVRREQLARISTESAQPFLIGRRALPPLLYGPDHRYARPLTGSGTAAGMRAVSRDDVIAWHRAWCRPHGATLIVVGDIAPEEAVRLAEPRLAAWSGDAPPPKRVDRAARTASPGLYLVDRPGAPQSMIYAAQLLPPRVASRAAAEDLMLAVLGNGASSRLFRNLREDKHWAYSVRSWLFDAVGPRPWFVATPVQTDRTAEAVREILRELRDIAGTRPPAAEEVQQARDIITLGLAGRWETVRAVSESIGEIVRFGLPDDYYATFADRVRATTGDEVAAAGRLIDPAQLVWVVAGDRAVIEPGLRGLGLGEIRIIDADGTVR
jgi:zinc protease